MFVRVKTSPNSPKKAVQIVENVRDGGKVKQRIVRHVGTALNDEEVERLKDLAYYILEQIKQETQPSLFSPEDMAQMAIDAKKKANGDEPLNVDLKQLREQQRVIIGIHEIYGLIYHELGFDRVFKSPKRKVAAVKNLFHMVMGRLANPASKLATVSSLEEHFGIKLSLASVYRMMDLIDEEVINTIQLRAYQAAQNLFSQPIRVAFYDCTTLYFESFIEDELKQKGYSKDMKFNQSQVLLALLVTESGLPLGYEVFEGSTFEGHTLANAIEKLDKKYKVKEVTFVADSAMFSKENIELLNSKQKKYVVGARLKNLPQKVQEEILDKQGYVPLSASEEEEYSMKEMVVNGQRLVLTYSRKNAMKDAADRQQSIDRLMAKLSKSSTNATALISNFGYRKFIKVKGDSSIEVDQQKIEKAQQWDGIHGIFTNDMDMPATQVIEHYHGLWQVEESFRISKHDLKVRPIYHWTPARIKAHIAICFIAFTCARHLSYRVRLQKSAMSVEKIRQTLTNVQLSILKDIRTNKQYAIPSAMSQEAKNIYHAVGLKLSDVPYEIV